MHSHRLGKSVQCSSDPEFVFSNVPQKCIKKWEIWPSENNISAEKHPQNLELNYILVGTSVRKQNNLQILLTGYGGREHFTISNDNSSVFTNVPQSLQMFLSLYKCSPIFANVPQSLQMFLNLCKCSSVFTNVPQSLQMFPNLCKCSSVFANVPQSLQMFLNLCKCSPIFANVPQDSEIPLFPPCLTFTTIQF